MKLSRRIVALEKSLIASGSIGEPTLLTMPDGRIEKLSGPRNHLVSLLGAVVDPRPELARQLELLRQSVTIFEPGGGQLATLARALLLSPAEEAS